MVAYVLCIIALDFRYWSHRLTHVNRFWWATHTHHSKNITCLWLLDWDGHNTLRLSSLSCRIDGV
jgi:sterol desaturase/sphingolipid hydroxylase (fatty acid hydroxylase superfamily)